MEKAQKLKTKVRFTSLDVAAMVSNFQSLIGLRATNIYDINPSTYLIKLAKSQQKHYLLIQNGVRFHTTQQKPDKKSIPSGFTMKFRKFLRSKRLQGVRQVGVERVVVLSFGTQAFSNHLILQLYSQGNIILTDNNYRILQCIRSHEFNDKVKTAVGQIYPFQYAANIYLQNISVQEDKIDEVLQKQQKQPEQKQQQGQKKKAKKQAKKGQLKLKDVVFKLIPCLFPLVIQHILLSNNKNPQQKVSKQNKEVIVQGGKICLTFLKQYLKQKHEGYLFQKQAKQKKEGQEKQYFQFSSYDNIKFQACTKKKYSTFNEAVSEYFTKYKKTQHQEEEAYEQIAWKKFDQIKRDQDERVKKLQEQQDIYKLKAQYIQKNVQDIDAVIKIIKTMEDNGYSWEAISRMIAQSKKNGDPLANMIHQLNILKRQVTVLLGDPSAEEQMFSLIPVEINIDYNAFTNATIYYESKKKNFQKQLRTKQASQQVLKIAQKDALKNIQKKKNQNFAKNAPLRKTFWFQKFNWFISSEGYLVISGRDSHQNQLVVKRYMKPGDLYMHSDYGGAASTVIKRQKKDIPVPRNTLEQAAIFTVCRSKAWDTKILSGAWWVYHDQVSKSAPTGEFLPTGSFMIRGKRNFIYPNRMQMGLTLLYRVDQQSAQRHLNDRKIHEEQIKEQQQSSKKPYQQIQTKDVKEEEQFAIVSIDMQTKKQKQQIKKQEILNLKKKPSQQHNKDQIQEKIKQKSSDSDGSQDSDDSNEKQDQKKGNQPQKKVVNPQKKGVKVQQPKQPQQKHKQRNKKKLKKLEKYLQEQDEDQRQVIMKMLGAKEMKHMKQQGEDIQQNDKKGGKKKKDKNKKKGIHKYIDLEEGEQGSQKLNPDKVLFLKQKKQESSSEQVELIKQVKQSQASSTINEGQTVQQNQQKAQEEKDSDQQQQEEIKEQNKQGKKKQQEDQEIDQKILDSELGELYKLVGKVHPEDNYECLVPMCAPYLTIKQNRFKVKLVPGGLKKGKAARNIMSYYLGIDLDEKQKLMVKSVSQQDVINSVIGNSKLAGAGLLKMQLKQKQEKKVKRKEQDKKKDQ